MSQAVVVRWDRASLVRAAVSCAGFAGYVWLRVSADDSWLPFFFLGLVISCGGLQFQAATNVMSPRETREAHRAGRWPLGRGYLAGVAEGSDSGLRGAGRLVFTEEFLEHGTVRIRAIRLSDVTKVHVKPSWIEVEAGGRRTRFSMQSFADRERLIFELAVRCPDAVDRGLDEVPPPPAAPSPAAPAGEFAARPAPSGLGSELAGPMDRGNPAPPRKSGLGVGLFPPGK